MGNLIISLEATCDLTNEMVKQNDLKIINMDFMIDNNNFSTANDDVVSTKLYENMRSGHKTSTTQINETLYETYFMELLKEGKEILHIGFSSGLSATTNMAIKVADAINKKLGKKSICVIDSLCACSGHGMLGIIARQYSKTAKNIEEVIEYIEVVKHNLNHCFSVSALKYLANGGRIKQASAIIGTILNIKPVMRMDEAGKLVVVQKVMSRKKALQAIISKCVSTYDSKFDICFVSHADCIEDAQIIQKEILEKTTLKPEITNLGPIIGCHSGPGTIALYFISKSGR